MLAATVYTIIRSKVPVVETDLDTAAQYCIHADMWQEVEQQQLLLLLAGTADTTLLSSVAELLLLHVTG